MNYDEWFDTTKPVPITMDIHKVFRANTPLTGIDIDWGDERGGVVLLTGQLNPAENGVYWHDTATRELARFAVASPVDRLPNRDGRNRPELDLLAGGQMTNERPALEFVLRAAENNGFAPGWDFGPDAGGCQHCPFAAGPAVKSWAQTPDDLEPYGNISNDPSEAHYWCHLPTRLRDGRPVALDDPWRNQWGEYGRCKMSEWAAQARIELDGPGQTIPGRYPPDWKAGPDFNPATGAVIIGPGDIVVHSDDGTASIRRSTDL